MTAATRFHRASGGVEHLWRGGDASVGPDGPAIAGRPSVARASPFGGRRLRLQDCCNRAVPLVTPGQGPQDE